MITILHQDSDENNDFLMNILDISPLDEYYYQ